MSDLQNGSREPRLYDQDDMTETALIRVTGPDHQGITAGLMTVLAEAGADIYDIEQIVICDQLTLGLEVAVPQGRDLLKDILLFGWERDLKVDFDLISDRQPSQLPATVITLVGPDLNPAEIKAAAQAIADAGTNIDRITRLSRYPVMSYELLVRAGDAVQLGTNLMNVAAEHPNMDIAIQRGGIGRRAKRLIVLDVDCTIINDEAIELLAAEAGCLTAVKEITTAAMEGKLDFETSLRERVRLLAGLNEAAFDQAYRNLRYTPGTRTFVRTLQRLGYTIAIISGGFTIFTDRIAAELGIQHAHANVLEIAEGKLTGEVVGPVVDRTRKAQLLREIAQENKVPLSQTVAIGDGANDLDMLSEAGLGIAFNAKPVVSEAADTTLSVPYLDAVLFILGIRREDVEAADREAADRAVADRKTTSTRVETLQG